jgi:hypothetical protein
MVPDTMQAECAMMRNIPFLNITTSELLRALNEGIFSITRWAWEYLLTANIAPTFCRGRKQDLYVTLDTEFCVSAHMEFMTASLVPLLAPTTMRKYSPQGRSDIA